MTEVLDDLEPQEEVAKLILVGTGKALMMFQQLSLKRIKGGPTSRIS